MIRLFLFCLALGGLSLEANSASVPSGIELQKMVKISSDRDSDIIQMSAMVDRSGDLAGFHSNGTRAEPIWLRDVEKKNGVVLHEQDGYKVLILQGSLSRETHEGKLTVWYLKNGLLKTYASCDLYIRRKGNSWFVQNAYTKKNLKEIRVVTSSLGVDTLAGLCPH